MATELPAGTKEEEFLKIIKEKDSKVVVVDFHATWCGPCKMIAPKLNEKLAVMDNVSVIKVDVDQCDELAEGLGISAMPTFFIYKNGEKVDSLMGANYEKLEAMVTNYL